MSEEQHKGPPAGLTGTVDDQDAGGGWILVRLMTKQAPIREGRHMDHCLQDGCYQEFAGEEELTGDAVWSPRDPTGVSWATLEIREGYRRDLSEPCLSNVIMAKGPGNRTVRRSVARRLQPLVLAFRAAGRELDFSGETEFVMADDGRVMRKDQAPADVAEQSRARHVARLVKLQKPQGEGWREAMQLSRDEWRDLLGPFPPEDPSSVVVAGRTIQVTAMSPSDCIDRILRRDAAALFMDTQAAFLRYGTGISSEEAPAPRSDPTTFINAVGAAMGLDRREVREVWEPPQERTFTMAARSLRGRLGGSPGCGGQYVLVPSTP